MHNKNQNEELFLEFFKNHLDSFLELKKMKLITRHGELILEHDFNNTSFEGKTSINASKHQLEKLYFGEHGKQFVEHILLNATEEQKKSILTNEFELFDYQNLIQASYNNPEDMKLVFKFINKNVLGSYSWQNIIDDMQKNYDPQLYDVMIDIFLSGKEKEFKIKKNKIIINLMLDKITDNKIYEKYINLIPNNSFNEDIFDSLGLDSFELNVVKEKLFSSVILKTKDDYNSMHETFIEKLNNEKLKQMLGLFSITGEVKFKSSKYFRYIVRVKEESSLDKVNTKLLVMSFYHLYKHTIENVPEDKREYEVIKEMSPELIYNAYLHYRASKNTVRKEQIKDKKLKI